MTTTKHLALPSSKGLRADVGTCFLLPHYGVYDGYPLSARLRSILQYNQAVHAFHFRATLFALRIASGPVKQAVPTSLKIPWWPQVLKLGFPHGLYMCPRMSEVATVRKARATSLRRYFYLIHLQIVFTHAIYPPQCLEVRLLTELNCTAMRSLIMSMSLLQGASQDEYTWVHYVRSLHQRAHTRECSTVY